MSWSRGESCAGEVRSGTDRRGPGGCALSVLSIFGIIAFGLSQGRLPDTYPGRAWAVYWAAGLCTAVVFFVSLLAHELAHAVVARRGIVAEMVAWPARIDVLLALFSALPAAPLDGGRLLRAFLWWRTGDRLRRGGSSGGCWRSGWSRSCGRARSAVGGRR